MHVRSAIWVILLAASPALYAQTLKGHVRDSTGHPIDFVSVIATDCRSEQILAFTSTDSEGFFRLNFSTECDSVLLTVRSLGYESISRRALLPSVQDFTLAGAVLKEVVIKGKAPPIVSRNDTTEYNVASFADSTEFSVEDILKKLPGMRVGENGRITLHGKEIERVLIEGDDLFSQNYQLATRNLRADMISKVQAIERFQENPLLKGIRESDRLVLNLKIKDDKKRSTSGSITPGLGHGDTWKAYTHTNLFSLARRDKTYLIGNVNNTGENALQDIQYLNQGDIFDKERQHLQGNPMQAAELLRPPAMENVGLPPAFTTGNRSGLLFVGHVVPFSDFFKTKISAWMGSERLDQQVGTETLYLLDTGNLDISEQRLHNIHTKNWHVQVESDYYSKDQRRAWRTFLQAEATPQTSSLELTRLQPGAAAQDIVRGIRKDAKTALFSLEYTIKRRENLVFQFTAKNAWRHDRQTLRSGYNYYPAFFGVDSSRSQLLQDARIRQFVSTWAGKCIAMSGSVQWELESGVEWETGDLESNISLGDGMGMYPITDAGFQNDFRLQSTVYFARLSGVWTRNNWRMRGGLGSFYNPVNEEIASVSDKRTRLWATEPRLDIRRAFGEKTVLSLRYAFQQKTPFWSDYHPGFVFSDYQTLELGLPGAVLMPAQHAGVRLVFNDRPKQFLWHIGITAAHTNNVAGTQFSVDPFLLSIEKYRPTDLFNYSVNAAANRYFPRISSRLAIDLGLSGQQHQGRINNDDVRRFDTRVYLLRFEYGTAFDTWLNGNISSQATFTENRNSGGQGSQSRQAIANQTTTAQIMLKPPGKFDAKLQIHRMGIRIDSRQRQAYYGVQAALRLRLPKWRSEIRLTGFNLLNAQRFERVYTDAFIRSTNSVEAVKPFFLAVWDYRF
jgi:hypothetical protein